MTHEEKVQRAISDWNARNVTGSTPGGASKVIARKPILATDCDYEIVRFSGVQGRKV